MVGERNADEDGEVCDGRGVVPEQQFTVACRRLNGYSDIEVPGDLRRVLVEGSSEGHGVVLLEVDPE